MQGSVSVVSLLTYPATVQINSGGTVYHYDALAGANAEEVPMGIGLQSFAVRRDGQTNVSGTSLKQIVNGCICGLHNFNAYDEFLYSKILGVCLLLIFGWNYSRRVE